MERSSPRYPILVEMDSRLGQPSRSVQGAARGNDHVSLGTMVGKFAAHHVVFPEFEIPTIFPYSCPLAQT